MIIKRGEKPDCIVAGMAIDNIREKEYDGKIFYEVPVSIGKGAEIINISIWGRRPEGIVKYSKVFACGKMKTNSVEKDGKAKTYYSLTADFIMAEALTPTSSAEEDNKLPF